MEEKEQKLPAYYIEGGELEWKLNLYKRDKERVIRALQYLNYQISNIEGKQEEVTRCVYGDMSLAVTFMQFSKCYLLERVFNDKERKLIGTHVKWYNTKVKEEQYVNAGVALSDLKAILLDLVDKKARLFQVSSEDIKKKAHTPIVIKAKKRVR